MDTSYYSQTPKEHIDLRTALIKNRACLEEGHGPRYDMRELVREGIRDMARKYRSHDHRSERGRRALPDLKLLIDEVEPVRGESPSPSECYVVENQYKKAR